MSALREEERTPSARGAFHRVIEPELRVRLVSCLDSKKRIHAIDLDMPLVPLTIANPTRRTTAQLEW